MRLIKEIVDSIKDELHGADRYAKLAVQYKDVDKIFADTVAKIAAAELDHVNLLHTHAAKLAKESPEKPLAMMAVYEYEHRNQIEWVARIKAMLDMYKTP